MTLSLKQTQVLSYIHQKDTASHSAQFYLHIEMK